MLNFIFRAGDTDYVEKLNKMVSAINLLAGAGGGVGEISIGISSETYEMEISTDCVVLKNDYLGDIIIVLNGLILSKEFDYLLEKKIIIFNQNLNEKDILHIIGVKIND